MSFHAFVSYNSKDRQVVSGIVRALEKDGLSLWFDGDELPPGARVRVDVLEAIKACPKVLVFYGPHGFGPFQRDEVDLALDRANQEKCVVIPVLLPGVASWPEDSSDKGGLVGLKSWASVTLTGDPDPDGLVKLRWGITGVKPDAPTPTTSPNGRPKSPIDQAVKDLADVFRTSTTKTLTYFLGPGLCSPPSAMAISRRLLSEINIAGDDDRLVPPIDLAGTYYTAANQGDPLKLLQTLFTMVEEVQTAGTTPVHSSLAALCGLLERRPMPRILAPPRPLIVSTNFDLLMERALLLAGISFTRVVQHRSAAKIEINEYQVSRQGRKILFFESESDDPAGGAARRIATREVDENDIAGPAGLDERILNHGRRTVVFETGGRADAARNPLASLSLRALDDREARRGNLGPVLYKCHGSQDIDGSYAASADQYYEYVRDTVKSGNIPEQLLTQIKDSSILFLGYGFLDPAFRLVYNTLLFDRVRKPENKLYAVRLSPQSQRALATQHGSSAPSIDPVEEVIWDDLKELASTQMGIKTVDTDELAFVKRLSERIAESFPQVAHS